MSVNTAALKTFAPAMRRQLIEAVGRKLDRILTSQTPDTLTTYVKQIAVLRRQEQENRKELLERVAYSWFNRLAALRYLDARGWHPFSAKVLMPATETDTQPELLKLMRNAQLPAELKPHGNETRLNQLLDGQIPTAIPGADPQGEVYRELVLTVCRFYHQLLPNLFEGLDDATELLLPDDLLTEGSVAAGFRNAISDTDCQDVEILGWLYQFYIAEKKDEVMARKKAVPTEDIPAVTQLFTPHWIVRYLVENSLGRLWLLNRPESKLRDQMPYYIEGETETDFLQISKPEEIKLLDPACGSGHMLTYAFDLLSHIYTEEGYAAAEIPGLILRHNLYGLDICPRAAQLAGLALVLKAREQSRRFFQPGQLVQPQIIELQDVRFDEGEMNDYIDALDLGELFDPNLFKLLNQFEEAKNFGSLIQPCLDERSIANVRRTIEAKDIGRQLFLRHTHLKVLRVLEQAEALTQRYHVIVANPPYMGGKQMNPQINKFARACFPSGKSDLFGMFIERGFGLIIETGLSALVTMESWMFLSSYADLRAWLIDSFHTKCAIHMPYLGKGGTSMGINFGTAATIWQKSAAPQAPAQYQCIRYYECDDTGTPLSFPTINERYKLACGEQFRRIPGNPIAYWISDTFIEAFKSPSMSDLASPRQGLITGENARFVRRWHEVSIVKAGFDFDSRNSASQSGKRWFPYNKGGEFQRWYGNQEYVVDWASDGAEVRSFTDDDGKLRSRPQNMDHYFQPSVSWSKIGSGWPSFRYFPKGFIFADAGASIYTNRENELIEILGFSNTILVRQILEIFSPTMNFEVGHISALPFRRGEVSSEVSNIVESLIALARADWDNFETSWNFRNQSLLRPELKGATLEASWLTWKAQSTAAILRMQELETENNRLFIAAYGLDGELQPEVPEAQITLARAEARRDVASFLSYATGCMMGRYSLDHPGLILANAGDTLENYVAKVGKSTDDLSFQPDRDGIIPVLDGEWFEDDIVARSREFLRVCFPASSLNTDLAFIETALGKDLRKYFCTDFYKDHLQTYKKRPIYWLVQSPAGPAKGGFACLIYLHRYTKDTLNQVLNKYFRPYLLKLETHLTKLGIDQLNDSLPTRDRTAARKEAEKITKVLKDCEAWEQDSLLPLAQQRIELDLDDGVKVNYLKLQEVLAPIPGLAAKEE